MKVRVGSEKGKKGVESEEWETRRQGDGATGR
jgi:hypothetical protein